MCLNRHAEGGWNFPWPSFFCFRLGFEGIGRGRTNLLLHREIANETIFQILWILHISCDETVNTKQ